MSLEAITKIREVESKMGQSRIEAQAQAQKLIAGAEKEGRELLQRSRDEAGVSSAAVMEQAEEEAGQRRKEILAKAEKDRETLKAAARTRMDKAVRVILERVVES